MLIVVLEQAYLKGYFRQLSKYLLIKGKEAELLYQMIID